eukprot:TRINITY_DN54980_c0_g1_i1.p1 TRINITY_DN54980_c0_g1~~TRINITY_DN54980_c0_g1_i1.p1  ORF type:complete len:319 (+),score=33.35 TRINITY_DN54980_c0_g1_i1:474-1430(+)
MFADLPARLAQFKPCPIRDFNFCTYPSGNEIVVPSRFETYPNFKPYEYAALSCLSEQERRALEQVKLGVKDIIPRQPEEIYTDYWLLGFLVARKGDVAKAVDMCRTSIQWRLANNADAPPRAPDPSVPHYLPVGIHKLTRDGHLVYVERSGRARVPALLASGKTKDDIVREKINFNEWTRCLGFAAGAPKLLVIMDMADLSLANANADALSVVKTLTNLDSENYPNTLLAVLVVNASFLFQTLWKAVRPFIDKDVAAKVEVLGGNYIARLLDFMDIRDVPDFLGGQCTTCEGGCIGGKLITSTSLPSSPATPASPGKR